MTGSCLRGRRRTGRVINRGTTLVMFNLFGDEPRDALEAGLVDDHHCAGLAEVLHDVAAQVVQTPSPSEFAETISRCIPSGVASPATSAAPGGFGNGDRLGTRGNKAARRPRTSRRNSFGYRMGVMSILPAMAHRQEVRSQSQPGVGPSVAYRPQPCYRALCLL